VVAELVLGELAHPARITTVAASAALAPATLLLIMNMLLC
jgi:hypothetical protein